MSSIVNEASGKPFTYASLAQEVKSEFMGRELRQISARIPNARTFAIGVLALAIIFTAIVLSIVYGNPRNPQFLMPGLAATLVPAALMMLFAGLVAYVAARKKGVMESQSLTKEQVEGILQKELLVQRKSNKESLSAFEKSFQKITGIDPASIK